MGLSIFEAWNKSIFSFGSTQRNYSVSVLKKPKKQDQSVFRQQKILQFFHLVSFMTFKNEENERDKSYTLISCTKQKVFLGCCKIPKLYFCFSWIDYPEFRELQTEMMPIDPSQSSIHCINLLTTNIPIIKNPVSWFGEQINWLVSIWWKHWSLKC